MWRDYVEEQESLSFFAKVFRQRLLNNDMIPPDCPGSDSTKELRELFGDEDKNMHGAYMGLVVSAEDRKGFVDSWKDHKAMKDEEARWRRFFGY